MRISLQKIDFEGIGMALWVECSIATGKRGFNGLDKKIALQ
jgi:hypothetical protein